MVSLTNTGTVLKTIVGKVPGEEEDFIQVLQHFVMSDVVFTSCCYCGLWVSSCRVTSFKMGLPYLTS